MSDRQIAVSGARWIAISSVGKAVVQFLQILVLARLLDPSEFGSIALVLSIVAILRMFSDAGLSNALIHYRDISASQLDSLFWVGVGVSAGVASILIVSAPVLDSFYSFAPISSLLFIAATTLIVLALGQQLRAQAAKDFRFRELAFIELVCSLLNLVVSISLAYLGAKANSVLLAMFVSAILNTILTWKIFSSGWVPKLRISIIEIRPQLRYGLYVMGNNLVTGISSQADILLSGRFISPASVGLYSVGRDISLRLSYIINPIVNRVAFPIMAKNQNSAVELKKQYLALLIISSSASFPVFLFICFFSADLVAILLGDEWAETAPILQILSLWVLVRSTGNPVGNLLMAAGQVDRSFYWNLVLLVITPVAVLVGLPFGAEGVALALLALALLLFLPNWFYLVRPVCAARLLEYMSVFAVPITLSLLSSIFSKLISAQVPIVEYRLVAATTIFGLSYLLTSYIWNRRFIDVMWDVIREQSKKTA